MRDVVRKPTPAIPIVLLLLLSTIAVDGSGGGGPDGGNVVLGDADPLVVPVTTTEGLDGLALYTHHADGTFSTDDTAYLAWGSDVTNVQPGFVRLTPYESFAAGTTVRSSHADAGTDLQPLDGPGSGYTFRTYDADGNGVVNTGDTVYVETCTMTPDCSDTAHTVATGWIRITPFGPLAAGTVVEDHDPDLDLSTSPVPTAVQGGARPAATGHSVAYWDLDGNGIFTSLDTLYWHVDAATPLIDPHPAVNDIRLTGGHLHPFGSYVALDDADHSATTQADGLHIQVGLLDSDADSSYDAEEPLYLLTRADATAAHAGAVRLTGDTGGSQVRSSDPDFMAPLLTAGSGFGYRTAYYDADGDWTFDAWDTLYLLVCRGSLTCDTRSSIDIGDLRLSTFGSLAPFTVAHTGDADLNLAVTTIPEPLEGGTVITPTQTAWGYVDVDKDDIFGHLEPLYWHLDRAADAGSPKHPQPGGYRVTAGTHPAGLIKANDLDAVVTTTVNEFRHLSVGFVDMDGTGTYSNGDDLYLIHRDTDNVPARSLRLTPVGELTSGTKVRPFDPDFDRPLQAAADGVFGYTFRYFDADGTGSPNLGDTHYLVTCTTTVDCSDASSVVSVGWSRLTPFGLLNGIVRTGDHDIGLAVTTQGLSITLDGGDPVVDGIGNWGYHDLDGDGWMGYQDLVVWHLRQEAGQGLHPLVGEVVIRPITAADNLPPTAHIASQIGRECSGGSGIVTLDGSSSSDPDADFLTYSWEPSKFIDAPTSAVTLAGLPLGATDVTLTVSDGLLEASAVKTFKVVDTQAPSIAIVRPAAGTLYVADVPYDHGVAGFGATIGPVGVDVSADIVAVGPLTIEADAEDACGIAQVEFRASDGTGAVRTTAPYRWVAEGNGEMAVEVITTDLAGMVASETVRFYQVRTA